MVSTEHLTQAQLAAKTLCKSYIEQGKPVPWRIASDVLAALDVTLELAEQRKDRHPGHFMIVQDQHDG